LTREGFDKYIQGKAEAGIPFSAYWYPQGFGLLITGKLTIPGYSTWRVREPNGKQSTFYTYEAAYRYAKPGCTPKETKHPAREHGINSASINRWRRNVARLKRAKPWNFLTVEFDGKNIVYEEA